MKCQERLYSLAISNKDMKVDHQANNPNRKVNPDITEIGLNANGQGGSARRESFRGNRRAAIATETLSIVIATCRISPTFSPRVRLFWMSRDCCRIVILSLSNSEQFCTHGSPSTQSDAHVKLDVHWSISDSLSRN
jgi:hypothetical protein